MTGAFAAKAVAAGKNASKRPNRKNQRIGSDARCIQAISILLAAKGAKPAAN